jgi:hypothetical protein
MRHIFALNPERDVGIKPRVSPRTRGHVDGKHLNPRERVAAHCKDKPEF